MCDRPTNAPGAAGRSTSGSIAILMGIMLAMLVGFAALGTEVVYALYMQSKMQSAASSAAVGAAVALQAGATKAAAVLEATAIAATAGFVAGASGVTVVVNDPPASSVHWTAVAGYVEVLIGQPLSLPMTAMFFAGPWQVNVSAVAKTGSSGSYCIEVLDPSGNMTIAGGVTVDMPNCGVAVNSAASPALTVNGGAKINAKSVSVVGTASISGGGSINPASGLKTGQTAVDDPYSATAVPSDTTCTYTNLQTTNGMQFSPGVYCGWGIQVNTGNTVTMKPGVYILKGSSAGPSDFGVAGGTVTGTGVTIVLTGSGANWASMSINNGAHVTLSAPTTGTTAGLLFFQDSASPLTTNDQLESATLALTGALYFPSQTFTYSNGVSNSASCTQLIAYNIVWGGGASFDTTNCTGTGVASIGGSQSQLVE